jgi:S-DNA-T family DNA segregation ATPase FtsK/SpoIIIE
MAGTSDVAAIRVGRDENGVDVYVDLWDSWHLAAQGMTRAGKSVLLYGLLAQAAEDPAIAVCGVDPTGVLFSPFADAPWSEWRASGTRDMPAAAGTLRAIVDEMDRRITELPTLDVDQLRDFTPDSPILLVVLEEYPGLLSSAESDDEAEGRKAGEKLAPRIRRDVRRLVQESAKVGGRVFLLAQRMDASIVGGAERSNLGTRFSLRVDTADAVRMLHPSIEPGLVEALAQAKPGQGVVDTPGEPLRRFKADFLDYGGYLARVRAANEGRNGDE